MASLQIKYSPFGQIVRDTNPSMALPIGFRGGIVLPYSTKMSLLDSSAVVYGPILYFMPNDNFRVYDSEIAQWLNPEWEGLASPNGASLVSPLQLFPYRFVNNDPINAKHPFHNDAIGKSCYYKKEKKSVLNFFNFTVIKRCYKEIFL